MTVLPPQPSSAPIQTRQRTAESVVWRGIKARNFVSSDRLVWDKFQNKIYANFLQTVGLNVKNCDITPLLIQLNLDGYDGVNNSYGQDVHGLIEEKVRRKLRRVADTVDIESLSCPSPGMSESSSQTKSYQTPSRPSSKQYLAMPVSTYSVSVPESSRQVTSPKPEPSRPVHPLLKMPKDANSQGGSAHTVAVKREPKGCGFTFEKALPNVPIDKPSAVKAGESPRIFTGSLPSPPRSPAKSTEAVLARGKESKVATNKDAVRHLCDCLHALKIALEDIGPAFEPAEAALPGDMQWGDKLNELATNAWDLKIDVDIMQELAEERI
ncbi:hypothetical protein F4780DRAFT_750197 [Xylariomycetidae sp. FL0641]|nr:hypothetical protein F4780DRAFT_750197 [Xylariomycetidae sp. FL0641]